MKRNFIHSKATGLLRALGCAAILMMVGELPGATAQVTDWCEDFEAYPPGTLIQGAGLNGWVGWGGFVSPQAVVCTTQAQSGTQSLCQSTGADSLVWFDTSTGFALAGADSGRWLVTGSGYMDSGNSGGTYFIMLNQYSPPGPWQWSVQFFMDGNVVSCDCGTNGTLTLPMTTDVWLNFQVDIDFDEPDPLGNAVDGIVTISYDDGTNAGSFPSYAWASGVFGGASHPDSKIHAIDLYPAGIATTFYWDDLKVRPATVGTQFCMSSANSMGNISTLVGNGSESVSGADLVLTSTGLPDNVQGIIYYGTGNGLVPFGDGLRCVFGTIQRFELGNAAGPANGSPAGTFIADAFDPLQNTQANLPLAAGTLYFQLWHRDPGGPLGSGFNFSNGLEIAFTP